MAPSSPHAVKGGYTLIRWDGLERQRYEDMVSVLVSRLHPDAQRIDGKGGDGGRDVQIVRGQDNQLTDAFELKSFTGRMTSGRRRQVEHSLKRAATLDPARWSLSVPIDPTPAEDRWFRQLGRSCGFQIAWLGRTWLDEKMSAFPDIRRYFLEGANDEVVRLLRELHQEQARVTGVHDAVARLRTLREAFFGSLQHEAQPVEVVQATAPTQPQIKAPLEKLPHYFPIPVGQFNSRLPRRILHRRLQLVLLTPVQDGGEPPVCSKTKPWAPPRRKLASQFPMV